MSQPILDRREDDFSTNRLVVGQEESSIEELSISSEAEVTVAPGKLARAGAFAGRTATALQNAQRTIQTKLSTPIQFAPVSKEQVDAMSGPQKAAHIAKNIFQSIDAVSAKVASGVYGVLGLVRKAELTDLTGIVSSIVTDVVAAAARGVTLVAGTVLAVAVSIVALVIGAPVFGIFAAAKSAKNAIAGKIEQRKELAEQASREAFLDKNLSKLLMINAGSKLSSNNVQTLRAAIAFASQHLPRVANEGEELAPTRFPQAEATAELVVGILQERLQEVQEQIATQRRIAQQSAQAEAQRQAIAREEARRQQVVQQPVQQPVVQRPVQQPVVQRPIVVDSSDDESSDVAPVQQQGRLARVGNFLAGLNPFASTSTANDEENFI